MTIATKQAGTEATRLTGGSSLAQGASPDPNQAGKFWKKPLEAMTKGEWESLCDGCGRCCLVKLEDEDTSEIHFTDVTCRLFEAHSCRCGDYPGRKAKVPDCVKLTPKRVREISWLPPTCAYRLVAEGKDLFGWHHLVSGSRETVHEAGVSVRGRNGPDEDEVSDSELLDRIVKWPGRI
jgi:uncharacterized cysteine cluster protein YcgN (CxxCxxCC family)